MISNWINANQTMIAIVFVIAVFVFYLYGKRYTEIDKSVNISAILLIIYSILIIIKTVLSRSGTNYGINTDFLWSYRAWLSGKAGALNQIFLNILLYIPLGCFGVKAFRGRYGIVLTLLIGLAVTITTEVSQYIFKVGLFEYDDILNNMIGTVLGIIAAVLINRINKAKTDKQREELKIV